MAGLRRSVCMDGMRGGYRNAATDEGAAFGQGADFEVPVEEAGAVAHATEAHAGGGGLCDANPNAIVLDGEVGIALVHGKANGNGRGMAVADGVGGGLLGDPVKVGGHLAVGDRDLAFRFEGAIDLAKGAGGGGELVEGGDEAGLVHVNGSDAAGDVASLDDGVLYQAVKLGGGPSERGKVVEEILMEGTCEAGDAGEVLAEAVVQIRADAKLLALAGDDDVALQLAEPAHAGERRLHAVAPALDGDAADGDEDEEYEPHDGLPDLHPTCKIGMSILPIGPPPHDCAEEDDEGRGFLVQEPDGKENGTGVKQEEADLVTCDVIKKTNDEDSKAGEGKKRELALGTEVLCERHRGGGRARGPDQGRQQTRDDPHG